MLALLNSFSHVFHPGVLGFKVGNYKKVIVTWGWTDEAAKEAEREGIELWDFRDILSAIAGACRDSRSYFADDTLRTIQLLHWILQGPLFNQVHCRRYPGLIQYLLLRPVQS